MMKKLLSVLLTATLLLGSVTVFAAEKKPVARETLATFFTTGAEERVPGEIVTQHLVTGQPKVINHVVNAFTYDVYYEDGPVICYGNYDNQEFRWSENHVGDDGIQAQP